MANMYKILALVVCIVVVLIISILSIIFFGLPSTKINCNLLKKIIISFSILITSLSKGNEIDCSEELFQAVKKGDLLTVEKFLTQSDIDVDTKQYDE